METATWLHLQDSYLYATRRELLKLSFYSVLFLPSKKFKVFSHEGIWGSQWIPLGEEIREIWLGTHISFTEIGRWDWIRLLGLHGPLRAQFCSASSGKELIMASSVYFQNIIPWGLNTGQAAPLPHLPSNDLVEHRIPPPHHTFLLGNRGCAYWIGM